MQLVRHGLAAVQIGQEADAQARQRARAARHVQRRAGDLDVVALVQVAVRAGARHGADAGGRQSLEQVPAPDAGRTSAQAGIPS